MTPKVSDFIPGSLEATDNYIDVEDGNYVTEKPKGQVQMKMCDDKGDTLIATLHNLLLVLDICGRFYSIIMLMY